MENATKALEMAGSVLIGVLLLGCILFAYTRMTELKDTEHKAEVTDQAKDFNLDYEAYNRDNLYGSDMFSLANKLEDYNKKEADGKSYGEISMTVKVTNPVISPSFFKDKPYTYTGTEFNDCYDKLSNAIKKVNNVYFEKNVSYWSKFQDTKVRVNDQYTRLEEQLINEMKGGVDEFNRSASTIKKLREDIKNYKAYQSEQKDMARKTFKCTNIEYYSDTGRIKKMEFTDK